MNDIRTSLILQLTGAWRYRWLAAGFADFERIVAQWLLRAGPPT